MKPSNKTGSDVMKHHTKVLLISQSGLISVTVYRQNNACFQRLCSFFTKMHQQTTQCNTINKYLEKPNGYSLQRGVSSCCCSPLKTNQLLPDHGIRTRPFYLSDHSKTGPRGGGRVTPTRMTLSHRIVSGNPEQKINKHLQSIILRKLKK